MKIYIAMLNDRHTDAEPFPCSTPERAIERARTLAVENSRDDGASIDESETPDGWLYHAIYSCEGDSVWVIEKDLDA
jgi:hypothetical protein